MSRIESLKEQLNSDDQSLKDSAWTELIDSATETEDFASIWEEIHHLPSKDYFTKIWKETLSKNPDFKDYGKEKVFDSLKSFHYIMEFIEDESNDPIPLDMLLELTSVIEISNPLLERNFPYYNEEWSKSDFKRLIQFDNRFLHFRSIMDLREIFDSFEMFLSGTKLHEMQEKLFFIKLEYGLLDHNYGLIHGSLSDPAALICNEMSLNYWAWEACDDLAYMIMEDLSDSYLLQFIIKDIMHDMEYLLHQDDWHSETLLEDSHYKSVIRKFLPYLLNRRE